MGSSSFIWTLAAAVLLAAGPASSDLVVWNKAESYGTLTIRCFDFFDIGPFPTDYSVAYGSSASILFHPISNVVQRRCWVGGRDLKAQLLISSRGSRNVEKCHSSCTLEVRTGAVYWWNPDVGSWQLFLSLQSS